MRLIVERGAVPTQPGERPEAAWVVRDARGRTLAWATTRGEAERWAAAR